MKSYRHPGLDKIVGRQLQIWETRREVLRRRLQEETRAEENLGPFIAISRLPFSRGDEVAQRVAEKLDWPLFDREIVDFIAKDANTLNQFVDSLDERCRDAMNDWIQTALDGKALGHLAYLRHLKRVLMTIAMHGNAVVLGRGANFVLPNEAGLRVLVSSPPRLRLQRLMDERKLGSSDAARELRKLDERRRDFLKTHFIAAGQELDFYDMILNLDQLDVDSAATMIVDGFYTLDRRPMVCPGDDLPLPSRST